FPFSKYILLVYVTLFVAAATSLFILSLHDALPIFAIKLFSSDCSQATALTTVSTVSTANKIFWIPRKIKYYLGKLLIEVLQHLRSEEHTSELQSREKLVCRLLLEKKNIKIPFAVP